MCGAAPLWLFASRGALVPHPHAAPDGPVAAMAPFHNANAPRGFILAAPTGDLRVCHLPAQLRLDAPWLVAKVPLRCGARRLFLASAVAALLPLVHASRTRHRRLGCAFCCATAVVTPQRLWACAGGC